MAINDKIFREYDIRGVADKDLPDSTMVPLGRAMGTFLVRHGAKRVTLGRDCRLSSPRVFESLKSAFLECGLNVVDIGLVPTPLLYFSVIHLKVDGGVMITGSHNPGDHNGFKIMSGKSTIYGEDIQEIRRIAEKGVFASGKGALEKIDIRDAYVDTCLKSLKHPVDVEVVIDGGNGMGGEIAERLYKRMGCKVTALFTEPDGRFPNHHPDPTQPENLADLTQEVHKRKAPVGIAFDGDADRIGAIDRSGRVLFGDELLILYARDILKSHPGAKVLSEVKASQMLFDDIRKQGGVPILWKTGHSLIKAKMKEEKALLAGEMSGHMFFNDRYFGYDDAIYAGARLLEIIAKNRATPMELLKDLPKLYSTPEIRVDCPDDRKFGVVDQAKASFEKRGLKVNGIDGARVEFGDGWGLVRASNTQPVLVYRFEASSEKRLAEIRQLIEGTVTDLISRT